MNNTNNNNINNSKDLIKLFQRIYGQQSPYEPLSSTSLYIIHSRRYEKPYKQDVKESIDNLMRRRLEDAKEYLVMDLDDETKVQMRAIINSYFSTEGVNLKDVLGYSPKKGG